ncbi:MAG: formylglycine-generating enzyme family protein [Cocleimonas sp.]|nr:formylglycine-generating enzyme family protein [Cocleimonas sp.]
MQTASSITKKQSTAFLPELAPAEIKQLQEETAERLNLSPFFSDTLKNGRKAPELAVIPAGKYEMGSVQDEFGHSREEYPQHYSHIHTPFAIGRFTITADDFAAFQQDTEWSIRPELIWAQGKEPMINIRMIDAYLYLDWLSNQTGERYRLPTESEWEYSARAGTTSAFHFGDEVSCKEVHFHSLFPYNEAKEKKRWYLPKCAPMAKALEVGTKPANDWGLYDVHGNVWEFTDSPWRESHLNSNRDGSSDLISSWVVTKGGSWFDAAIHARSAARKKRLYEEMDTNLGFRVVRELV